MAYIGQSLTEGTRREYSYVATAGQTVFPAVYTVGAVDVHQNGILLPPSDYIATDGTTVVFATGCAVNDEVVIHCHNTFSVADTVSASQGGTFNQPITVNSDAATVLTVDRATSDGTLVDFKKNGTTVGSIGTIGGFSVIGSGDTGILFDAAEDAVKPRNSSTASRDAAIDLGGSGDRFKNLYLSGGVYLGGTGVANLLDDYEEGTFTPVLQTSPTTNITATYSVQNGRYLKIGSLVRVTAAILVGTASNQNAFWIGGLPFASASSGDAGPELSGNLTSNVGIIQCTPFVDVTSARLEKITSFTGSTATLVVNSGYLLRVKFDYTTT